MSDYRNRPKGNYIQRANWEDLYILTEKWKYDLEFYLFDIQFSERLLDTYFVKLLLSENLYELRELQNDILDLKNKCKNILQRIPIHLSFIVDIIDGSNEYNTILFRKEHEQFEDEISRFIDTVKVVRKTVISMTKDVLENDKSKYIWKFN